MILSLQLIHVCIVFLILCMLKVVNLQAELSYLQAHLATLELPSPPPPPPPPPLLAPSPFSISDLPFTSSPPTTLDLSTLFDPLNQPQLASQPVQQHGSSRDRSSLADQISSGGGDLQALARELLHRHHHHHHHQHAASSQSEPASSLPK